MEAWRCAKFFSASFSFLFFFLFFFSFGPHPNERDAAATIRVINSTRPLGFQLLIFFFVVGLFRMNERHLHRRISGAYQSFSKSFFSSSGFLDYFNTLHHLVSIRTHNQAPSRYLFGFCLHCFMETKRLFQCAEEKRHNMLHYTRPHHSI